MSIEPEQFDKAFVEFQAFGSRHCIPILESWREVQPNIAPAEFAALKTECEEIETFALKLAERARDKQISDGVALKQFAQKCPLPTGERLGHTWSQTVHFSLK